MKLSKVSIAFFIIAIAQLPVVLYLVQRPQTIQQQASTSINCDIDQNTFEDTKDYAMLITCMKGESACTSLQQVASDLSEDGKVDEKDINLFLKSCKNT